MQVLRLHTNGLTGFFSGDGFERIRLHAAIVFVLFLILFLPWPVWSQSRIAGTIDDTRLVTLPGNTHSLAQPAFDRGAVLETFLPTE